MPNLNMQRAFFLCTLFLVLALATASPLAAQPAGETAQQAYARGMALQKDQRTLEAITAYQAALRLDPRHGRAHYELGWSYWILGDWPKVVEQWEAAVNLHVPEPDLPKYLEQARSRMRGEGPPLVRVPMHTRAAASDGTLTLELVARYQQYSPEPADPRDHYDPNIFSPKSVTFSADGAKAYVNALEGGATLVYDTRSGARLKVISHHFDVERLARLEAPGTASPAALRGRPERFMGKPVESVLTHGGRYLWITYYRWDYDRDGVLPSAVAVVDTRTDEIVRVMPSGPIPKFLAASPDGRLMAVIHWGDNSVGLTDISAAAPQQFRAAGSIVVGKRLPLNLSQHVDRDRYCGYCLRGAVFTPDSRTLLVGRMGGGGIAVLDVAARKAVGSVQGMPPTPRHLVLSPDGARLYVSSNVSGFVSVYRPEDLVAAALRHQAELKPLQETSTGSGTRTIALTPDGRVLFAAVNRESKLVALDAASLRRLAEIPVDSYPVGLDVSPDGSQVWVTSQGVHLEGGNSVSVYQIARRP